MGEFNIYNETLDFSDFIHLFLTLIFPAYETTDIYLIRVRELP